VWAKAQRLSDHFGFKSKIIQPMTIAEIARQEEPDQKPNRFRLLVSGERWKQQIIYLMP
jgi:hypothetical protein